MQKTVLTAMQNPKSFEPRPSQGVQWQQTVVMRNAQNQEEAFSIGPDGLVWSFIADGGDSRFDGGGQRLENLGLEADFLTVGRNAAGALVVIAAKGLHTQYRTETPPGTGLDAGRDGLRKRWSPGPIHPLTRTLQGATGVRRLYTQSDFSGMRIAMIVDTEQPGVGASYVMACSQWHETGPGPFILLPPLSAPSCGANQPKRPQATAVKRPVSGGTFCLKKPALALAEYCVNSYHFRSRLQAPLSGQTRQHGRYDAAGARGTQHVKDFGHICAADPHSDRLRPATEQTPKTYTSPSPRQCPRSR
ncbi:hypothetical protein [Rhodoferax sp.]|uniref:hypothetical protein n=1 Tax=Rhodoferax sp. TaxID=50421 RepID=UPI002ACE9F44|nr:hypothetical protein [Rhodoferax sp.]MDZ7918652.1 hypothetical protein [Rhodoferax sp.]